MKKHEKCFNSACCDAVALPISVVFASNLCWFSVCPGLSSRRAGRLRCCGRVGGGLPAAVGAVAADSDVCVAAVACCSTAAWRGAMWCEFLVMSWHFAQPVEPQPVCLALVMAVQNGPFWLAVWAVLHCQTGRPVWQNGLGRTADVACRHISRCAGRLSPGRGGVPAQPLRNRHILPVRVKNTAHDYLLWIKMCNFAAVFKVTTQCKTSET